MSMYFLNCYLRSDMKQKIEWYNYLSIPILQKQPQQKNHSIDY